MAVSSGTVGSGSKIKYVSYGSGDTLKDIFDGIASILTTSGGWTLASGTSGSFYTTYYSSATNDFRRVYSAPLLNTGSGLTTKYVMLRIRTTGTAGYHVIQLIPFGSWNSGTDVGTNQAGTPLLNNQASDYGFDCDWISTTFSVKHVAPNTFFATGVSGLLYIAFDPSAAYIMMWPYFTAGGAIYNGNRAGVLMYGEYQEDFTAYTNVPPVYVTTLQRLSLMSGTLPTYGDNGSYPNPAAYQGANNTNIGSLNSGLNPLTFGGSYTAQLYHQGPLWLSPVAPGSTTGYSGVANTIRTGPQASAFQRMLLGQLGEYGFTSYQSPSAYTAHTLVTGNYPYEVTYMNQGTFTKNVFGGTNLYNYTAGVNSAIMFGQTALNSTNLKGIEPILGGGCTYINNIGSVASMNTAYAANPFPLLWMGGRMRGLKFVGSPTTQGAWSTLDTVNMTVDANGFFVKTGGTSTSFALIGFAPFSTTWAASYDPNLFFAIPS